MSLVGSGAARRRTLSPSALAMTAMSPGGEAVVPGGANTGTRNATTSATQRILISELRPDDTMVPRMSALDQADLERQDQRKGASRAGKGGDHCQLYEMRRCTAIECGMTSVLMLIGEFG